MSDNNFVSTYITDKTSLYFSTFLFKVILKIQNDQIKDHTLNSNKPILTKIQNSRTIPISSRRMVI